MNNYEKVYNWIVDLEVNKVVDINVLMAGRDKNILIESVKRCVDNGVNNSFDWVVEFNSDYSKLRKILKPIE